MNRLKKLSIVLVVAISAMTGSLYGQPAKLFDVGSLKFAGRIGVNFSGQVYKQEIDFPVGGVPIKDIEFQRKPGVQLGIVVDYDRRKSYVIQSGLFFSQQGYIAEIPFLRKEEVTLNYIHAPVFFQYKRSVDVGEVHWILQTGAYVGVAVGGKNEINGQNENIKFGSGRDSDFRRFDFGVGFGGGIQLNKFQLGVVYNIGLANLVPYTPHDAAITSIRNNQLTVNLSYFFQ